MSMTPNALREAYLSFFESKGHTRYPSDSLVPANDPTLLFTGAGMNQFKEMFMGVGNLPFVRATTSQKCLRTGDLDNVGRTYYHQTFFEMLGNFSFGDYFKKEAIAWQWEFLTEVLEIPASKLRVSVYEEDEEAFAIWRDVVGLPESKIWKLDAKENYWPADAPEKGPNGPCGPCSEIFFDFGSPQRNIDTGMGFERILAVMNDVRTQFETELFLPTIREVAKAADVDYTYDHPMGQQFRRIAEHVRAAVFLIADGVKPSNEGRGYVVRRIIRRAVRDAIALGIDQPIAPHLVQTVVEVMGEAYPEVVRAQDAAVAFIRAEAEKFRETYETGIQLLENEIAKLGEGKTLAGETAFALYDSHGFPVELSEEILAVRGLSLDRDGFERCMQQQRQRSREGSDISGEVFVATTITAIKREVAETEFLGYETCEADSEIVAIFRGESVVAYATEGEKVQIVTRETPFYAESGGQVGDSGAILGTNGNFRVSDTQKKEGYIIHTGTVMMGDIAKGNQARMRVDWRRRAAITRNHTATHLLHAALRTVLGKHVTQAGSRVDPDRLRFDFTHPKAVRPDEIEAIEAWVNDEIFLNAEVVTRVMPIDQARDAGAMALFGEKYGSMVRVVTVGEFSTELCGGIHVATSAEIGGSLLLGESGVASGVRRIEMVTGGGTLTVAREQRETLQELTLSLKTRAEGLPERIAGLLTELRDLRRRDTERKKAEGLGSLESLLESATTENGIAVVTGAVEGSDPDTLRSLSDAVRKKHGQAVVVLAGRGTDGVALLATATDAAVQAGIKAGDLLRGVATAIGGKGGGRPQMAQGRAPSDAGLEEALAAAKKKAVAALKAG